MMITWICAWVALAGAGSAPGLRLAFDWGDGVTFGNWTTYTSWGEASTGYPDDSSDDAEIEVGAEVTFDFSSSLTIDDLILFNVFSDFGCPTTITSGSTPAAKTLSRDTVVLGGSGGKTIVCLSNGARIVTY
ncbi:MAG: hypothetical protein IT449_00470 [Phycisphaerales bacterium]|nr:hypothetical protein [Phycisphaerales bacterium]